MPEARAAAERLLPDDRAGRLVVDVEVAGREAQHARCACAIAARSWAMIEPVSAYGATDSIWVEHRVVVGVVVDVHARIGPKYSVVKIVVRRVGALDDRRPHEVALAVVGRAAGDDRRASASSLGPVERRR